MLQEYTYLTFSSFPYVIRVSDSLFNVLNQVASADIGCSYGHHFLS